MDDIKYISVLCHKCDGRGYIKDHNNNSFQCDICKGKGETKYPKTKLPSLFDITE
jgi:DnaJ-class molecular chaperone